MRSQRSVVVFLAVVSLSLITSPLLFAYIDPGAGSLMLQGALAGVGGFFLFLKVMWKRIKAFFKWDPRP